MFEQAFKNIDDVLWKDAGCTSELDYTEQTSWLLFLKYLDALESDRDPAVGSAGFLCESFDYFKAQNPNGAEEIAHRSPQDIMAEIEGLDTEAKNVVHKIRTLLG